MGSVPLLRPLTLQLCRGESPASPHTQGFRLVFWTSCYPTHPPGIQRPKPGELRRIYRKQLVAPQPAQVQMTPRFAHLQWFSPPLPDVHTSSHTHPCFFSPHPRHGTHTCRGVSICIFGVWLVSEQAEDLSF